MLARIPNTNDHASPEKIGSKTITQAPITAAPAVSTIGRRRTAPASRQASRTLIPRARFSWMKSTRRIEFRTTMPASAITPIMPVAVKKIGFSNAPTRSPSTRFRSQKPGKTPIIVSGIASMISPEIANERVCATSST